MTREIEAYFLEMAKLVGSRSTCDRGRAGCVIVRNKQVLVTGYAGSPTGLPHCDDVGHEFEERIHSDGKVTKHCIRTIHAEQNALIQAALHGVSVDKATLYCTMTPCYACAKLIVNAGIKNVVVGNDYHDAIKTKRLFLFARITLIIASPIEKNYEDTCDKNNC